MHSTHITLVVDRSGSMDATLADAQGGLNAFLKDQKALPGQCSLTLCEFDDRSTGAAMAMPETIDNEV